MIGLLQRVTRASVTVSGDTVAEIGPGLLVLVGVQKGDGEREIARLAERLLQFRVFPDADERMNLSLVDTGKALLLVPQFTLAADTRKGTRAGFSRAAAPDDARRCFEALAGRMAKVLDTLETGVFGANMQVSLTNDGPVTFWLEVKPA